MSKNNPVITPSGIIGKISVVNNNSSVVQLISDPDFRVGVRFLPSGATGILRWRINNICDVREVYKNSIINVGDRVVTSGLSDIFPTGLPVSALNSRVLSALTIPVLRSVSTKQSKMLAESCNEKDSGEYFLRSIA